MILHVTSFPFFCSRPVFLYRKSQNYSRAQSLQNIFSFHCERIQCGEAYAKMTPLAPSCGGRFCLFAAIMMTSVGVLLCKSINLFVASHESSRILDIQKNKGHSKSCRIFLCSIHTVQNTKSHKITTRREMNQESTKLKSHWLQIQILAKICIV
jgi:hypothetical protein